MSEESHQIFEIDVERFDCKRSQCWFYVDKWVHSISLVNVQPEENEASSYGNTIPRNFDVWFGMFRKTLELMNGLIWMDGILIWLDGIPIYWTESGSDWTEFWPDWTECCRNVDAGKKSAWTDLDRVSFKKKSSKSKCLNRKIGVDRSRPSQFRNNLQCLNVQIEKSAWTGLGKIKKGLFSGKCL